MKRTKFVRIMALLLAVLTISGTFVVTASAASPATGSGTTAEDIKEILNSDAYSEYSEKFYTTDSEGNQVVAFGKGEEEIIIPADTLYSYESGGVVYYHDAEKASFYYLDDAGSRVYVDEVASKVETYEGKDGAVLSPTEGTLTWNVVIPSSGRYAIEVEYYPLGTSSSSIERTLYIGGKVPFAQARYLTLSKIWRYDYPLDENGNVQFKEDINGNQLKPSAVIAPEWTKTSFTDPDGFYQGAFEFIFDNKGESNVTHTISLASTREAMYVGSIRLYPLEDLPTYDEILEGYKESGKQAASSSATIKLEAEIPYRVSDTSVFSDNDRSSAVNSPISASAQLLNVLGAKSYNTIGQWASYKFTVTETGLYTISIRCKQDQLAGMYTSRTIRLAGGAYGDTLAVPFAEAYNTRFDYDKSWQIATLGDGTNVFQFYFEAGETYYLSLDVSLGTLSEIIETVEASLDVINDCYLEILKLTGAEPDEYRDYNFYRVMPRTVNNLLIQYGVLDSVSKGLVELSGSTGAHVATLDKVAFLLYTMGYHEDKIASNLDDLKSYIGTLGTWLNTSKQQSLTMDYIVINGTGETNYSANVEAQYDKKEYKENASFLEAAGFEIVSFFNSFFIDYNHMGVTLEGTTDTTTTVEVWLATGRDQANIWRALFDSEFSSKEVGKGIAVDLKLVAGGSLLPSVLAKQGPDVYMGLDAGSTINYAIRNAVLPITSFAQTDGEILNDFNEATLVPLTIYNQLYGAPETVSFSMMFYRKDVLANLKLDVPKTWDDLLTAVPVLQSSNMEIGLSRSFDMFLYQAGGQRWIYGGRDYDPNGQYADLLSDPDFSSYFDYMEIGYGENVALTTFKFMCRFFTDYSFPVAFDAANRFRTGEMPIVISDAVSLYNTLTVFATEIRGLWMFTDVPGTERSDGTISRVSVASVTAIVMLNGVEDADASWRFMSWQISPTVQASYANSMVALIGPSAKYATANREALFDMSWTAEEATNLRSQFDNLATIPNYPGAYIIQRYLDFAFLNSYNDGLDPVEQLQGYVKTINVEITRKRQEFDLPVLEDGQEIDDSIAIYLEYLKKHEEVLSGFSESVREYVNNYNPD